MIDAKRSKTTDKINGDNLWLEPQGRSKTTRVSHKLAQQKPEYTFQ